MCGTAAFAFQVKGYEWGSSLEKIEEELKQQEKTAVFDEKNNTLVFSDKMFNEECKMSLLFTPKSKELAGIAMVWPEGTTVLKRIRRKLGRKYGKPLEPGPKNKKRKYLVWRGPAPRYERIVLIESPRGTLLGYYGGKYYKTFEMESEQEM